MYRRFESCHFRVNTKNDFLGALTATTFIGLLVIVGVWLDWNPAIVAFVGATIGAVIFKFFSGPSEPGEPWYR